MPTLSIITSAILARKALWLLITLGFVVVYYAGLLAGVVVRFGELPNYVTLHDYVHNVAVIIRSTPSVRHRRSRLSLRPAQAVRLPPEGAHPGHLPPQPRRGQPAAR